MTTYLDALFQWSMNKSSNWGTLRLHACIPPVIPVAIFCTYVRFKLKESTKLIIIKTIRKLQMLEE